MTTNYNIEFEKYSDYKLTVLVKDSVTKLARDLTGYSAVMEIRARSGTTVLQSLVSPPTSGTGIDMSSAAAGTIVVTVEDAVIASWTWTSAQYDIKIVSPASFKEFILEGLATVSPRITQAP